MDRDLVEERGWAHGTIMSMALAFSQLSPGPPAAQLAMYLGWVPAGRLGAALVAAAFIAPSFLMAVAVAAAYIRYERLPWIQEVFYGVGAAVIAIIAQSAYRLSRKTIGRNLFLWGLFAAVVVTTVWTASEIVWLFVLCGVMTIVVNTRREGW
jgi:chromate transporter